MPEEIDRLGPAVFNDLELFLGQIAHRITAGVADDHVDPDDVDATAERRLRPALRGRRILCAHQRGRDEQQGYDDRDAKRAHSIALFAMIAVVSRT